MLENIIKYANFIFQKTFQYFFFQKINLFYFFLILLYVTWQFEAIIQCITNFVLAFYLHFFQKCPYKGKNNFIMNKSLFNNKKWVWLNEINNNNNNMFMFMMFNATVNNISVISWRSIIIIIIISIIIIIIIIIRYICYVFGHRFIL
jgi:hypothetical protein